MVGPIPLMGRPGPPTPGPPPGRPTLGEPGAGLPGGRPKPLSGVPRRVGPGPGVVVADGSVPLPSALVLVVVDGGMPLNRPGCCPPGGKLPKRPGPGPGPGLGLGPGLGPGPGRTTLPAGEGKPGRF